MVFKSLYRQYLAFGHSVWRATPSFVGPVAVFLAAFCVAILYVGLGSPQRAAAESPAPPSPVIANLVWAPPSTIQRAAEGSDNWPLTWADNGNLYTAYGDGRGFRSAAPEKLSLGFAQVSGGPKNFVGINIPSLDAQLGDQASGKKASGMLMVDGVLYMWVRNADESGEQCQVARSTNYALSWTWAPWTFSEFGYCTFINYGRNYARAQDEYVYMVSHDHPSAYTGTNDFILTRVPKDQILNRFAYEFFVGLDLNREPLWSASIALRGPVFSYPDDRARRSGITYNAAIGRYLWWHGFPGEQDERYAGGFGVYDAPAPWGPWTTVYYTDAWDVGPGETASFPTKWMNRDGTEVHLVFSGDDAFSVRKAVLQLRKPLSGPLLSEGEQVDRSVGSQTSGSQFDQTLYLPTIVLQ